MLQPIEKKRKLRDLMIGGRKIGLGPSRQI
jgi:hypothetical protein